MEREEIAGISKEFDQVLKQVEPESEEAVAKDIPDKPRRRSGQAWRQPVEEENKKIAEEASEEQDEYKEEIHHHHRRSGERRTGTASSGILHPSDGLIAAFFVPVIIMIAIFAQRGIFPFGQESFLRTDMYHQYAPFFSEFQHKLREGGSLLYSWDIGLGVNFAALYAYYLASPLNWLLLLCPKELIIEFMTYSVVIKTGLCGLTFAWYLRKHNNRVDFGAAFFAVFYALSGYMAAYSWNIMWLDCILLFPLIMLGLERLVKEKKPLLYCVALGLSILSNYYISIMICVFMVMYFICLLILEGRRGIKDFFMNLLQFGLYSLIAGGLAAVVLLPEVFALQSTASGDFNFPKTFETYFSIFDMLARHIGNVQTETGLDHWPNIYCGVAVFMFFLLYLVCRKIPVKEKAVTCGLLLMFFASFSVNVLNFMWHGFHYPNSLPCRQSFIYIFLMLALCYRAYMYLDVTPKKYIAFSFWGAVCYVLLAQKFFIEDKAYHFSVFYVAILFLAAYAGLMYLYKNRRLSNIRIALLALSVVAVEAAVNTTVTSVSTTSRTAYKEDNKEVLELTKNLSSDNGFFRVEKIDRKTKNDGAWMNFPSVSLFSSLAHADLSDFFKKVGCESSTNAYSITGSTPLIDSLFSVKYALYPEAQTNSRLILNQTSGNTYLYENPYTLPMGFMIPDIMEDSWQLDMQNPVDVQNDLSDIMGVAHSFSDVNVEETGSAISFTPEKDGEYYVYISNKKVKSVTVTMGDSNKNYDNMNRGYLLELGFCPAGETIMVKNKDAEALNASVYLFEEEGLKAIYEVLNTSPLNLIKWEDDKLEGVIEMQDTGTLFMSVPYDKGWSFKVDGQPVTAKQVFTAFTGLELEAGRHTVTMKYTPEGLKEGVILSGVSVGLLILLVLMERFGRMKKENKIPTPYKKLDEEWRGVDRREENE